MAEAHRLQHLGVAARRLGEGIATAGELRRRPGRRPRQHFGGDGERDQQQRAGERGVADPWMEDEADPDVDRHPRHVEQRAGTATGQEAPDLIEVTQRLQAVPALPRLQRQPHHRVVDLAAELLVERKADVQQDARAQDFQEAHEDIERGGDHHQPGQRRQAAARDHPVVDLQHEERSGERENVDETAHQRRAGEGAAKGGDDLAERQDGRTGCRTGHEDTAGDDD
jgi:hypothetical protein